MILQGHALVVDCEVTSRPNSLIDLVITVIDLIVWLHSKVMRFMRLLNTHSLVHFLVRVYVHVQESVYVCVWVENIEYTKDEYYSKFVIICMKYAWLSQI